MTTGEKNPIRLSREEIAQREIGRTEVSGVLAWTMTVLFLATLFVPPTVQLVIDLGRRDSGGRPACVALVDSLPSVAEAYSQSPGSRWNRLLAANARLLESIDDYETQLEDRSWMTERLLGPTQELLTGLTGLGNERVCVGRDGWLFYRPDVEYLTGPGFLEPAVLKRRALGGKPPATAVQPDPRGAILEFHEQLAARGIRLIVMPVPGKPAVCPERLAPRFVDSTRALENVSFRDFVRELQDAGVLVFDCAPRLRERMLAPDAAPPFISRDTHWTPEGMQAVVDELAEFIGRHCPLPAAAPVELTERKLLVESAGDIAAMLHLPERQALFPLERVTIGQVVQADDRLWEPDKTADILLLGDSFTNIYSLAGMRWGTAAGLAERLSFALRRPVDRLAQNDGGAHAVRQALAQQIARGNDRLAGKRIVIWQFAARELASGDWKRVPLPERVPAGDARHRPADPSTDSRGSAGDTGELLVRGVARAASGAPQPGSVPYRDAITSIQLVEIEPQSGSLDAREIVVYLWGMRDNRWTSAARWKPGQKLTLRLTPWESVEKDYGRINRVDLDDPEFRLIDLPVYWGEEVSAPSHQR